MKLFTYITNGVLMIVIALLHLQFALSKEVFGLQFQKFAGSWFFNIHPGTNDLPFMAGHTDLEAFAAFWFFYFGLLLLPVGLLVHSVERKQKVLPSGFTVAYLIVVLIGAYMIPHSGMTFIMLPHALYMLIGNCIKKRRMRLSLKID
jgi:hypothetical protein